MPQKDGVEDGRRTAFSPFQQTGEDIETASVNPSRKNESARKLAVQEVMGGILAVEIRVQSAQLADGRAPHGPCSLR